MSRFTMRIVAVVAVAVLGAGAAPAAEATPSGPRNGVGDGWCC